MKQLVSDYRTVIIALLAVVAINIFAIHSNKRITQISGNISAALGSSSSPSTVLRNLLTELRVAENSVKAYNLTSSPQFLGDYAHAMHNLKDLSLELQLQKRQQKKESQLIDSVLFQTKTCIAAIKTQLNIENGEEIIRVLDKLPARVDAIKTSEAGNQVTLALVPSNEGETKKKWSLRSLFKSSSTPTVTPITTSVQNTGQSPENTNPLKSAIRVAKKEQQAIIAGNQQREFLLTQKIYQARVKMIKYYTDLQGAESLEKTKKVATANSELLVLKTTSRITYSVLTFMLVLLVIVTIRYVKKRKLYEAMLIASKNEAELLAKTRESFLANMSHEVKTPLNAIHGFSQVLLDSPLNADQKKQISIIKESSAFLSRIVSNILDYAKLEAGQVSVLKVDVKLCNELDSIYAMLLPEATKRNNTFVFDHAAIRDLTISTDLDKLKQILLNLIGNAIKFTSSGLVKIETNTTLVDGTTVIEFKISDTGIGIKKENLSKLFNEFEQGGTDIQARFGGNGLGLHISKRLTQLLGGTLSISSTVNVGTTASLILPIKEEKLSANITIDFSAKQMSLHQKRILIADDDHYNRALLSAILKKRGATVFEAENGFAAINLCFIEKPDLIIMDVRMPEMNGIDATAQIRTRGCTIPIIGATAVASQEKIEKCRRAGMTDIVFKPFTIVDLMAKITKELVSANSDTQTEGGSQSQQTFSLDYLIETADGDIELRNELIALFQGNLLQIKNKLRGLIEKDDFAAIYELVHRTVPSCKHFEAKALLTALSYFEELKNSSYIDKAKLFEKCTEVEHQILQVQNELKTAFDKL